MAKSKIAQTQKRGKSRAPRGGAPVNQPVSEGIKRAAERAGIARPGELEALRAVAVAAQSVFDATGVTDDSRGDMLAEALRYVSAELEVVTDAVALDEETIDPMVFVRLRRHITLAITLADHREKFGRFLRPETATESEGAA